MKIETVREYGFRSERYEQEKVAIENQLQEGVSFSSSERFVVVYRGGQKVYRNFGSYLDTAPRALATFLEVGAEKVKMILQTEPVNTFQVIDVMQKRIRLSDYLAKGYHKQGRSDTYLGDNWEHARFNEVFTEHTPAAHKETGLPDFYKVAAHEAVGHGLFQPALIQPSLLDSGRNSSSFVGVLNEGVTEFIADLVVGENSHANLAWWLFNSVNAMYVVPPLSRSLDVDLKKDIVKSIHKRTLMLSGITVPKAFEISAADEFYPSEAVMIRGASLAKYITEKYGAQVLVDWVSTSTRDNYIIHLEKLTGSKFEEVKSQWKKTILSEMHSIANKQNDSPTRFESLKLQRKQDIINLVTDFS